MVKETILYRSYASLVTYDFFSKSTTMSSSNLKLLFTCCCSHVSSCKIKSFFNFELAVLCLQVLHMCINIHFDPLCWDNEISLKKSSRRDEVSNSKRKTLVVKNITPSRDGITFTGNHKCFF